MSISLKADASGTFGTIQIAGVDKFTVKSDGTVESLEGGKLFGRSNLLGTVSQSGGVPTGAVIERDSNTNGEYIKFADGTLIMTRAISIDLTSTAVITNASYPATFVGDRPCCAIGGGGTAAGFEVMSGVCIGSGGGQWIYKVNTVRAGVVSFSVLLTAIGRWF